MRWAGVRVWVCMERGPWAAFIDYVEGWECTSWPKRVVKGDADRDYIMESNTEASSRSESPWLLEGVTVLWGATAPSTEGRECGTVWWLSCALSPCSCSGLWNMVLTSWVGIRRDLLITLLNQFLNFVQTLVLMMAFETTTVRCKNIPVAVLCGPLPDRPLLPGI